MDQLDAETGAQCSPDDCRVSFRVLAQHLDTIGDGVDALGGQVRDLDARISAMGERMSAQEMSTRSLWHEVRTIGHRLTVIPERVNDRIDDRVSDAVRTHAADCAGRELARSRLTYHTPQTIQQQTKTSSDKLVDTAGVSVPRWIAYAGAVLGAAGAAAAYLLHTFGVF